MDDGFARFAEDSLCGTTGCGGGGRSLSRRHGGPKLGESKRGTVLHVLSFSLSGRLAPNRFKICR
jgi:hypothetical protein